MCDGVVCVPGRVFELVLAGGASPPVALEQREYRGECVLKWRVRWGELWGGLGVGGVRIGMARVPEQCVYAEAEAGHLVRIR